MRGRHSEEDKLKVMRGREVEGTPRGKAAKDEWMDGRKGGCTGPQNTGSPETMLEESQCGMTIQ